MRDTINGGWQVARVCSPWMRGIMGAKRGQVQFMRDTIDGGWQVARASSTWMRGIMGPDAHATGRREVAILKLIRLRELCVSL